MTEVVSVSVHGLDELERRLMELPEAVAGKALQTAVNAGARVIKEEAMARAPVGSVPHWIGRKAKGKRVEPGNLRRYIRNKKMRGSKFSAASAVYWSGNAFYGKFLEFGTSKMKAQPFLRAATDTKWQAAVEATKAALARRIKAAAKKLSQEANHAGR